MRKLLLLLPFIVLFSCTQLKLARKAYDQQNYRETLSICKGLLRADSTNAEALELSGEAYTHLDLLDSAISAYKELVFLRPGKNLYTTKLYNAYVQRGDQLTQNEAKMSLLYFDEARILLPDKPHAYEKKGDALFRLKRYNQARVEFLKSAERNPDTTSVRQKLAKIDSISSLSSQFYQRGVKQAAKNRYDAAKKEFERALEIKPDNKDARFQLHMATAKRLYKKGSVNALWEAIDHFASASLLYPDRAEPHYFLGLAYNKKDKNEYTNAMDELLRAAEVQPESKWARAARKEVNRISARKKKMDAFWGK